MAQFNESILLKAYKLGIFSHPLPARSDRMVYRKPIVTVLAILETLLTRECLDIEQIMVELPMDRNTLYIYLRWLTDMRLVEAFPDPENQSKSLWRRMESYASNGSSTIE